MAKLPEKNKQLLIAIFQETIGMESKELPNGAQLSIRDQLWDEFLDNFNADKERVLCVNSILQFWTYYKVARAAEKVQGIGDTWTNFIVLILFGLIEGVMTESEYIDCYTYLNRLEKPEEFKLKESLERWRKEHGSNEKIREFFKIFTSDAEKENILEALKSDPRWSAVNDLDSFVNKVIKYRNNFAHTLSLESIAAYTMRMTIDDIEKENYKHIWYPTISIDLLTQTVLKGVIRKFDVKAVLKDVLK